jgi:hypothetical protein
MRQVIYPKDHSFPELFPVSEHPDDAVGEFRKEERFLKRVRVVV